jgi:hypothetical protein
LGNLAYDGYGFYLGCFRSQTFIEERQQPDHLKGYARNIFDQGLGRSLWFHHRGNWQKIEKTIRTFTTSRQRDLWFGIGLACTYIGNLAPSELKRLRLIAGADYNYLASGAAVAAKLRVDAGNMTECTEIACFNLAHKTAMAAAEIANTTLTKAKSAPHDEQYAAWQKQLFASFA